MANNKQLANQANNLQQDLTIIKAEFHKHVRRNQKIIYYAFLPFLTLATAGVIYFVFTA